MYLEEIQKEISELTEQGDQYHEKGLHARSLECHQKALKFVDELEGKIANYSQVRAALFTNVAGEHRDCDNYHYAVQLLFKALMLMSDKEDTVHLQARIKKLLAITFRDIYGPQRSEVLDLLEESRKEWAESQNSGQEANVLQHIGGCYVQLGRLPEADGILQEAFRKAIEVGDTQLQGWILDDMAEVEIERGHWGMALDYVRRAQDKAQEVNDQEGLGDTWVTEARIRLRVEQTEAALAAAQQALQLYTSCKNRRRTIRARHHIAKVLLKLQRADEALEILREAIKTSVDLFLFRDQAQLQLDIGEIELARKNYGLAHQHAASARALADEENIPDLLEAADDLFYRCHIEERRY